MSEVDEFCELCVSRDHTSLMRRFSALSRCTSRFGFGLALLCVTRHATQHPPNLPPDRIDIHMTSLQPVPEQVRTVDRLTAVFILLDTSVSTALQPYARMTIISGYHRRTSTQAAWSFCGILACARHTSSLRRCLHEYHSDKL